MLKTMYIVMVEFNTMYYAPADREMHELDDKPTRKRLEDPIIPIKELGVTVPEMDPSGRGQSFVKNVQAAIRRGTGQLQIVMQAGHTSPVGGRFKGAGKEVREKLKEVLLANDAQIVGFELPTSLSNLSGLDQQKGAISEETRQKHLKEIHDAIKFASDIGQGGGIQLQDSHGMAAAGLHETAETLRPSPGQPPTIPSLPGLFPVRDDPPRARGWPHPAQPEDARETGSTRQADAVFP